MSRERKTKMCKIKETEVAKIIYNFWENQGYDVYPEAQMRYGKGRADIAGVKKNKLMVTEVKTSLSLKLLEQADEWLKTKAVNFIYVAVPSRKITNFIKDICKWKGFGLVTVYRPSATAKIVIKAKDLSPSTAKLSAMINSLHPDMKNYQPGTMSGYSTPYNRTINKVEKYIIQNPGSFVTEVIDNIDHHYATRKSGCSSLIKAIKNFEQARLSVKKRNGRYRIYPVARK